MGRKLLVASLIGVIVLNLVIYALASAQATYPPPFKLSAGTELSIVVRGYDGSTVTQHVHPSILVFMYGLNGYRYVMALTPYPNGNNAYEHPSIVFSNDLETWTEDGVSNPIAYNSTYYNADPHLVYDPVNRRLIVYYMRIASDSGASSRTTFILAKYSYDGISWSDEIPVLQSSPTGCGYVSPAVVYDKERKEFLMWVNHVNYSTQEKEVLLFRSNDGFSWSYVGKCNITQVYNGQDWVVWHLSVRKVGNEYWMIAAMNPRGTTDGGAPIHLFFFKSRDGLNWIGYSEPILTSSDAGAERLYRADFFVYGGCIHVFYSWRASDGSWHISYTHTRVGDPALTSSNVINDVPTPTMSPSLTAWRYHVIYTILIPF